MTEVPQVKFPTPSSLTDQWVNYAHIMSAAQNSTQTSIPPLDEFIETARKWLEAHTEYRAGGMSIYQFCIRGGSAIGAGVWGAITTTFGLDVAFLISGISVLTCLFLKYPEVK